MTDNKFIIVVPVYNSEAYIEKSIESILSQDYKNYQLIVVDDCSTDKTYDIICDIHTRYNNFIKIRNEIRIGSPLHNLIKGINLSSKNEEDIVITVDGDDWLYDNSVLSYLNEIYQDDNIYVTYGQYVPLSQGYSNYCKPIPNIRMYRRSGWWTTSHLRTFKIKLYNKIRKEDLIDKNGDYYKTAGDLAVMYPLIEMAGAKHTKFIDKVLYVYNDLNPINEMKVQEKEQLSVANEIHNKPLYNELIDKI
jgi:glycosyltransferase involved in cell wall biosynthesis